MKTTIKQYLNVLDGVTKQIPFLISYQFSEYVKLCVLYVDPASVLCVVYVDSAFVLCVVYMDPGSVLCVYT